MVDWTFVGIVGGGLMVFLFVSDEGQRITRRMWRHHLEGREKRRLLKSNMKKIAKPLDWLKLWGCIIGSLFLIIMVSAWASHIPRMININDICFDKYNKNCDNTDINYKYFGENLADYLRPSRLGMEVECMCYSEDKVIRRELVIPLRR